MKKVTLVLLATLYYFVVVQIQPINALSCLRCDRSKCRQIRCRGGVGRDVCGCCDACNKLKGQSCGGPFGISGTCDKGLFCKKKVPPRQIAFNIVGKCVRCPPLCRRRFPYGNVLNKNGCPICKGRKPRLLNETCSRRIGICKHGLKCTKGRCKFPSCGRSRRSRYHHHHCRRKRTVFCSSSCRCCVHHTACNPNRWYYGKSLNCCAKHYTK